MRDVTVFVLSAAAAWVAGGVVADLGFVNTAHALYGLAVVLSAVCCLVITWKAME